MSRWPVVPLSTVVFPVDRSVPVLAGTAYRTIGVRWWGEGAYERITIDGSQTAAKTLSMVRQNDLIINKIWVRHGSVAVAGEEVDGCAASGEFPTFQSDENRVLPRWLHWICRTKGFWSACADLSRGTSGKNRIRPERFLTITIPLPPVDEQRRVVARIEAIQSRVDEGRVLRRKTERSSVALISSARAALVGVAPGADWVPLRSVLAEIENGKSPQCLARAANEDEWGVLKVGAVSFGLFDQRENKALPVGLGFNAAHEVRNGDFLMCRANTAELVGACAIIRSTRPKLLLSDKTFRFHFLPDAEIIPEWLDHILKSPALRAQIERAASGTSPTMKNISKEKVMSLLVPPHSRSRQVRVVAELGRLDRGVGTMTRLQGATAAELDAMLPAILDRALRGDL